MTHINIDLAVEYVKDIVKNNKCASCDRLNAVYLRYACGHFNCQNCVSIAEECLLCLTPQPVINNSVDKPLSQRTEYISNLLTSFQDLFNLNVFRRHRISEQLKVEKQVFPECIQAPSKYCNKRKSTLDILIRDKENIIPSYPGENISCPKVLEMENKNIYVKKWLDSNLQGQNKQRKAFTDLGVNRNLTKDSIGSVTYNIHKSNNGIRKINRTLRKRNKYINDEPIKKKLKKKVISHSKLQIVPKNDQIENDESGIFIDDIIVIDESQNVNIDKDMLACQAIKEAEKKIQVSIDKDINVITKTKLQSMLYKVPFYKKSSLYETCNLCKESINCNKTSDLNPVTIIIDSKSFVTTLNISNCKENNFKNINSRKSVAIQTDDNILNVNSCCCIENNKNKAITHNKNFKENIPTFNSNKEKGIIVSESEADSDADVEIVKTLKTIADIHTTASHFSDFKVLTPLEPLQKEGIRKKNVTRGPSPLSTDSSDKENYDPNRAKRQKFNKKSKK